MSTSITGTTRPRPRVRHQARDALVLMAFSAGVSGTLTLVLMAALALGRQG
jgi:hypothetical protein